MKKFSILVSSFHFKGEFEKILNLVAFLQLFGEHPQKSKFFLEFKYKKPKDLEKVPSEIVFPMNMKNKDVGKVLVEEKKHNFKFSFCLEGNEIVFFSKNKKFVKNEPKIFADARKKANKANK